MELFLLGLLVGAVIGGAAVYQRKAVLQKEVRHLRGELSDLIGLDKE